MACLGALVPEALLREHPDYETLPPAERERLRCSYDFEYWAATCAMIKDKVTARDVRLRLNAPQRRLLAVMEGQRMAGEPVRVILLKARQWGGSTLVQLYMAWIQLTRRTGWNSLICGHRQNTSRAIKQMYSKLLRHYPEHLWPEGEKFSFSNYEGSREVQQLAARDCLVIAASSRSEDAARGYNLAMAHLTEVAFWAEGNVHDPADVIRSVCGTVLNAPGTVVVLESTANGVGNYFHTEWLRAAGGQSDKKAVFVPWFEIEIYRRAVADAAALWSAMDDYEHRLWQMGCTLEMINWYHHKRKEYATHAQMMEEFPTTDVEAFSNTGCAVFDALQLRTLRLDCRACLERGDVEADYKTLRHVRFVPQASGALQVWQHPDATTPDSYLVVVDVGGRSPLSDWSVILVMKRPDTPLTKPEVVAQWRGHIDHDLLGWKAAQIATYYKHALLVIESNSLEREMSEPDGGEYILNVLDRHYKNMYRRKSKTGGEKPGFHTNRETKRECIQRLISAVRDHAYVERDGMTVDEMTTYETHGARFEAQAGHHDDLVMTRAIALMVMGEEPPRLLPPINRNDKLYLINSK
ncbi:MAG: hypothetical protein IJ808_05015 [Muribaculaceae bacterium]|nr:hypothetical protein [Muribaculaceae bacterium]